MITPGQLTLLIFVVSIGLIAWLMLRPGMTASPGGKMLAFVALFLLPLVCGGLGLSQHFERSEQTSFCLSCHVMEPYGRSLYVDDAKFIPASHFQNHRVPADQACYTCHTDYALYGGIRAKLRGLHHVYVQYLSKPSQPIKLYTPYNNRECLHCHLGARSFEEQPVHMAIHDDLVSNQLSCVSSGCHDSIHNVAQLGSLKMWSPAP